MSAADLESGNADKGLSAGVGDGEGDWHLELETPLDVEPLAYVRHAGGFVATMHDVVAQDDSERYHVPTFNPASSRSKVSRLRLVNQAGADAEVLIEGLDDRGALPEYHVRLTLPAHGARTVSAQELESGASGLTGRLGDGEGKWRLFVLRRPPDPGDEPAEKPERTSDQPVHVHHRARRRASPVRAGRPARVRYPRRRQAAIRQLPLP